MIYVFMDNCRKIEINRAAARITLMLSVSQGLWVLYIAERCGVVSSFLPLRQEKTYDRRATEKSLPRTGNYANASLSRAGLLEPRYRLNTERTILSGRHGDPDARISFFLIFSPFLISF